MRLLLIAGWLASVGGVDVGCGGSAPAASGGPDSFCGVTGLFDGACGGAVSGGGTTPFGSTFDPMAVYVALGSTCSTAGTTHYGASGSATFGSPYCHFAGCP